ncbi:peptidoglycan recognition protein family protein [Streptomyces sp. rh34]|uniref:peptidoglycan recognition protein family protein n=1 Tax=Streptomyces sp. rh34 TaxID=2034272 RepID=UPI000BF134E5|nr:N-acetylmuramoyl-L-alanine amidase [Streptomyces sp. rh34]
MAWYPGAKKMELQPESDAQAAIRPTQLIVHSIVANWTARRTYEFWRDSTNLESHFGIGYGAGDIAQYIGTETRADANAGANRRSDGSGAISVETASNSTATDPWNASQVEELIKLGVWAHQHHRIPLRICRTASDPGFGYHSMFAAWSTSGTACPGKARIKQFREVVFPGIVARATGKTTDPSKETDMPLTKDDIKTLATTDGIFKAPKDSSTYATNKHWSLASHIEGLTTNVRLIRTTQLAQAAAIQTLAGLVGKGVDTTAVVDAVEKAIADAVIKVDVDINSKEG